MGIQHLNRYLQEHCPNSIHKISLSQLRGKRITIDICNYLYRFLSEEALLENVYLMISMFRYYDITPIFIFDGKSPYEKKEILEMRKERKKYAKEQYEKLVRNKSLYSSNSLEYEEISNNMNNLKKKFIQLKLHDIKLCKMLMNAYGVTYIDADGEADALCAKLVVKKYAYACMSEDMDMFVYGCSRVLRYLSLVNNTVIMYNLKKILEELNYSINEFKQICILSGTDYNFGTTKNTSLYQTIKLMKKYKKEIPY